MGYLRSSYMKLRLTILLGFLGALLAIGLPDFSMAEPSPMLSDLSFDGDSFPAGLGTDYVISGDGVTIADTAVSAVYTSPVLKAETLFNVIVPQWLAKIPESASMELQLRTAKIEGEWSQWYDIHEQPDSMLPGDVISIGDMIAVPADDVTHQYLQFSISFSRYDGGPAPILKELHFTPIDSTEGPTVEEMVAKQQQLDEVRAAALAEAGITAPDGYPRPTVISREVWCWDADCDYSNGLHYEAYTHLVVHHTVTSNNNADWAAIVRAIWRFHTYDRGWGDIGYNYLVDMNGIIYEGHNNQNFYSWDVTGTHASEANGGGMGVALIGTFTSPSEYTVTGVPPQAMLESAAKIMAWKADQRGIDVYDASEMPYVRWGLPNLMGHRDVYGGTNTTCPGGEAYDLLPWLRNRVAQLIGFTSPHIYVDELSSAFTRSDPNLYWWEGPRGCGNNGHSYYTWSVTNPSYSTNWGEWRPSIAASGRYEVEVYAPYCDTGEPETDGATYEITHVDGVKEVVVSHSDYIGLWMPLGAYHFQVGGNAKVRLTDLTTTDSEKGVWFDAIRLRQLPPTAVNLLPAPGAWFGQRQISLSWTVDYPGDVQSTILQVATDPGFSQIVASANWSGAPASHTFNFDADYQELYWRVVLNTIFGSEVTSVPTRFGIDATRPTSDVTDIFRFNNGNLLVKWSGSDAHSGVATYNIDYSPDGGSNWIRWLTNKADTSGVFYPPDSGGIYLFRSQATDNAGNQELAGSGDIKSSQQAILLPYEMWMPVIFKQ